MTTQDLLQLLMLLAFLAIQWVTQALYWSRKIATICEAMSNLKDRCRERGSDHKHHYVEIEKHGNLLVNHEARIVHLEKQPS